MKKLQNFEILNHGIDHCQYFPGYSVLKDLGYGVSGARWTHAIVGAGGNAREAYLDALEQTWSTLSGVDEKSLDKLPSRPRGIRVRDKVPADANEECYWYVILLLKIEEV